MATGGIAVGGKPCAVVAKFMFSPMGEALVALLKFDVGSLLILFAKGALAIVASVAECGICSSLLALTVAVLRI
jgi:hypothetical protein